MLMLSSLDRSFSILCIWNIPVKHSGKYLSILFVKLLLECKYNDLNVGVNNLFVLQFLLSFFDPAARRLTCLHSFLRRI